MFYQHSPTLASDITWRKRIKSQDSDYQWDRHGSYRTLCPIVLDRPLCWRQTHRRGWQGEFQDTMEYLNDWSKSHGSRGAHHERRHLNNNTFSRTEKRCVYQPGLARQRDFSFCSSKDRKHFRSNTEEESGGLRNSWLTIPCSTALHMAAMTCQCAIQ